MFNILCMRTGKSGRANTPLARSTSGTFRGVLSVFWKWICARAGILPASPLRLLHPLNGGTRTAIPSNSRFVQAAFGWKKLPSSRAGRSAATRGTLHKQQRGHERAQVGQRLVECTLLLVLERAGAQVVPVLQHKYIIYRNLIIS